MKPQLPKGKRSDSNPAEILAVGIRRDKKKRLLQSTPRMGKGAEETAHRRNQTPFHDGVQAGSFTIFCDHGLTVVWWAERVDTVKRLVLAM